MLKGLCAVVTKLEGVALSSTGETAVLVVVLREIVTSQRGRRA